MLRNKVFRNTGFTIKTAVTKQTKKERLSDTQKMREEQKLHKKFLEKIFDEDPKEKLAYYRLKYDAARTTGSLQK